MTHTNPLTRLLEMDKRLMEAATTLPWKGDEFEITAPKADTLTPGAIKLVLAEDYHLNEWDAKFILHAVNTLEKHQEIISVLNEALEHAACYCDGNPLRYCIRCGAISRAQALASEAMGEKK